MRVCEKIGFGEKQFIMSLSTHCNANFCKKREANNRRRGKIEALLGRYMYSLAVYCGSIFSDSCKMHTHIVEKLTFFEAGNSGPELTYAKSIAIIHITH